MEDTKNIQVTYNKAFPWQYPLGLTNVQIVNYISILPSQILFYVVYVCET